MPENNNDKQMPVQSEYMSKNKRTLGIDPAIVISTPAEPDAKFTQPQQGAK